MMSRSQQTPHTTGEKQETSMMRNDGYTPMPDVLGLLCSKARIDSIQPFSRTPNILNFGLSLCKSNNEEIGLRLHMK